MSKSSDLLLISSDFETKPLFNTSLNPSTLTGIQFWAEAYESCFRDTGCNTPVLGDGTTVLGIKDFSGNNNNATQATSANAFTFKLGQVNGQPALTPVGATSTYTLANSIFLSAKFSIYCVSTRATSTTVGIAGVNTTPFIEGPLLFQNNKMYLGINSIAASFPYSNSNITASRFRRDASNITYGAITGQAEQVFFTNAGTITNPGTLTFGQVFSRASAIYTTLGNQISLLGIVADDTVTNGQDTQILAYINSRYKINIP